MTLEHTGCTKSNGKVDVISVSRGTGTRANVVFVVPLEVKLFSVSSCEFNVEESNALIAIMSPLIGTITAEVARRSLHFSDEGRCDCITDRRGQSAPSRFGAIFILFHNDAFSSDVHSLRQSETENDLPLTQ